MQGEKQEAGKQVLAITAAGEKDASSAAWSCMDGLWEALGKGAELRAGQPVVLAQAVRALLGLWQVQVPKMVSCYSGGCYYQHSSQPMALCR